MKGAGSETKGPSNTSSERPSSSADIARAAEDFFFEVGSLLEFLHPEGAEGSAPLSLARVEEMDLRPLLLAQAAVTESGPAPWPPFLSRICFFSPTASTVSPLPSPPSQPQGALLPPESPPLPARALTEPIARRAVIPGRSLSARFLVGRNPLDHSLPTSMF